MEIISLVTFIWIVLLAVTVLSIIFDSFSWNQERSKACVVNFSCLYLFSRCFPRIRVVNRPFFCQFQNIKGCIMGERMLLVLLFLLLAFAILLSSALFVYNLKSLSVAKREKRRDNPSFFQGFALFYAPWAFF